MLAHLLPHSAIERFSPFPLRLIVGYGFMEHGFAKLAKDLTYLPISSKRSVCPNRISWPGPLSW
jgi:hypothetical protein